MRISSINISPKNKQTYTFNIVNSINQPTAVVVSLKEGEGREKEKKGEKRRHDGLTTIHVPHHHLQLKNKKN